VLGCGCSEGSGDSICCGVSVSPAANAFVVPIAAAEYIMSKASKTAAMLFNVCFMVFLLSFAIFEAFLIF
jgi:hypothetical protein